MQSQTQVQGKRNFIIRYIVSAYFDDGRLIHDWIRVYKTIKSAEKRYNALLNDYEVEAQLQIWNENNKGKWKTIKHQKAIKTK